MACAPFGRSAETSLIRPSLLGLLALLCIEACGSDLTEARAERDGVSWTVFADRLSRPEALVFDGEGNLFVSQELDLPDGGVVRITRDGIRSVVAAGLSRPDGLAFDVADILHAAEEVPNGRILRLLPAGPEVVAPGLNAPEGLLFEPSGDLLITEDGGGRVLRVGRGEPTVLARLNKPEGIARHPDGRIFVAESGAGAIRVIDSDGSTRILADGLNSPDGLAYDDRSGSLFVSEDVERSARLLRVDSGGGVVTLLGGLNEGQGITVGRDGDVYVIEQAKGRVLRVSGDLR